MPRAARTVKTEKKVSEPKVYRTEELLHSKVLAGYQKDFVRVLLTKPEYTLAEARAELDKFFGKEGKK